VRHLSCSPRKEHFEATQRGRKVKDLEAETEGFVDMATGANALELAKGA
jgi:hypothetical protein